MTKPLPPLARCRAVAPPPRASRACGWPWPTSRRTRPRRQHPPPHPRRRRNNENKTGGTRLGVPPFSLPSEFWKGHATMTLLFGFAPFFLFAILSRLSADLALWLAFASAFVVTI